ncbi:MAG: hypothetical protein ACRYF5_08400 [Janthinobacterium lividum]
MGGATPAAPVAARRREAAFSQQRSGPAGKSLRARSPEPGYLEAVQNRARALAVHGAGNGASARLHPCRTLESAPHNSLPQSSDLVHQPVPGLVQHVEPTPHAPLAQPSSPPAASSPPPALDLAQVPLQPIAVRASPGISPELMLAISRDDVDEVLRQTTEEPRGLNPAFHEAIKGGYSKVIVGLIAAGADIDPQGPLGARAWQLAQEREPRCDITFDSLVAPLATAFDRTLLAQAGALLANWINHGADEAGLCRAGMFACHAQRLVTRLTIIRQGLPDNTQATTVRQCRVAQAGLLLAWQLGQQAQQADADLQRHHGGIVFTLMEAGLDRAGILDLLALKQAQARTLEQLCSAELAAACAGMPACLLGMLPSAGQGLVVMPVNAVRIAQQLSTQRGLPESIARKLAQAFSGAMLAANPFCELRPALAARIVPILSGLVASFLRDRGENAFHDALAQRLRQACGRPDVALAWPALLADPVRWLTHYGNGVLSADASNLEQRIDCLVLATGMPALLAQQLALGWQEATRMVAQGHFNNGAMVMELLHQPPTPDALKAVASVLANVVRRPLAAMMHMQLDAPGLAGYCLRMHGELVAALDGNGLQPAILRSAPAKARRRSPVFEEPRTKRSRRQ